MVDAQAQKESAYYQHSGSLPFASKLSYGVRLKMFQLFMRKFAPGAQTSVLDVGVTCDTRFPESNYFEKLYPFPDKITCVGTEDGSHLMGDFPGLKYHRVVPGRPLPFETRQFDVVFSNATVEHVGSRAEQAAFLAEICRVGKSFFITTPNRWFPLEHHTGLPLVHFLPASIFRRLIKNTRYDYWANESTLNILTASGLKAAFPVGTSLQVDVVRVIGFGANLVAYGTPPASSL